MSSLLGKKVIENMEIKQLDDNRDITSTGYIVQRKKGPGKSKPVGSVYLPAKNSMGYRVVGVDGKTHKLHRLVWQAFNGPIPEGVDIDHVNGQKPDNRLENLRLASRADNLRAFCKPLGGSSKYRGVCWNKPKKKWHARIQQNGELIHIGYYETEVSAALARDAKALELGWPREGLNLLATT